VKDGPFDADRNRLLAQSAPAAGAAPGAPVKTHELASEGFRQALAVHQAAWSERHVEAIGALVRSPKPARCRRKDHWKFGLPCRYSGIA
jgi:hypothetical protein